MNKAFTLAEVLITLMIIGVIASLTIPSLESNTKKTEYATQAKKAYSILTQAQALAQEEYSLSSRWPMADSDTEEVFGYYKPHFNITKYCFNQPGCWTEGTILNLNKSNATGFSAGGYGAPTTSFKLADGMNVTFDITPNAYLQFWVDVNGDKNPNTLGVDIFGFIDELKGDGLVPMGYKAENFGDCADRSGIGTECAARVIREGKIDY